MQLPNLIAFKELAAQLSPGEAHQFITHLSMQHSDLLISALFTHLTSIHTVPSTHPTFTIGKINNMITGILESRKEKDLFKEPSALRLDSLPRSLIGVTASFLEQRDYARFSHCNRLIYLGCNLPNHLQELNLLGIDFSWRIEFGSLFKTQALPICDA